MCDVRREAPIDHIVVNAPAAIEAEVTFSRQHHSRTSVLLSGSDPSNKAK